MLCLFLLRTIKYVKSYRNIIKITLQNDANFNKTIIVNMIVLSNYLVLESKNLSFEYASGEDSLLCRCIFMCYYSERNINKHFLDVIAVNMYLYYVCYILN